MGFLTLGIGGTHGLPLLNTSLNLGLRSGRCRDRSSGGCASGTGSRAGFIIFAPGAEPCQKEKGKGYRDDYFHIILSV